VQYDGHTELLKAAPKRLNDAQELVEPPSRDPRRSDARYRHLCGTYYLAGYAVECVLKVYTIMALRDRIGGHITRWSHVIEHFSTTAAPVELSGKRSHDLGRLLMVARLGPDMDSDQQLKGAWGVCGKWDYNVRYRPEHMLSRGEVVQFVEACNTVYEWVRARLP
jgi:hypothetical protein